jgi:hypothetical protein
MEEESTKHKWLISLCEFHRMHRSVPEGDIFYKQNPVKI